MDTTRRELWSMIIAYRVPELQTLLTFAGKNKTGRKDELQERALELVRMDTDSQKIPVPLVTKIKELYRSMQLSKHAEFIIPPSLGATGSALTATGSSGSNHYGGHSTQLTVNPDPGSGSSLGYQPVIGVNTHSPTVPICPDVKMKELPFYDILAVLLRPTSLLVNQGQSGIQQNELSFCLTPSQSGEITNGLQLIQAKIENTVQVQLRFCALDTSIEQSDLFPPGLVVKVNGQLVELPKPIPIYRPGMAPKRPSKPLDITTLVKWCPLTTKRIQVQWIADDSQRNYCLQVNLVKKLTAEVLFGRLKQKGIQPADFTKGRIKEIITAAAEEEDLCAPTSLRVSVACPLGKMRMTWPCRATSCKHLQCFDAKLFLLMNEMKPTFACPVCNKLLKFGDLSIDGYFMDVLKNLSVEDDNNEVELFADGSWLPASKLKREAEDAEEGEPAKPKRLKLGTTEPGATKGLNDIIDLDDNDDDEIVILDTQKPKGNTIAAGAGASSSSSEPEIIDLLISSSDDEEGSLSFMPMPIAEAEETRMQSLLSQLNQQEQVEGGEEFNDLDEIVIVHC